MEIKDQKKTQLRRSLLDTFFPISGRRDYHLNKSHFQGTGSSFPEVKITAKFWINQISLLIRQKRLNDYASHWGNPEHSKLRRAEYYKKKIVNLNLDGKEKQKRKKNNQQLRKHLHLLQSFAVRLRVIEKWDEPYSALNLKEFHSNKPQRPVISYFQHLCILATLSLQNKPYC